MLNEIIGTVIQVLIFTLIPLIVYLIKKKTAKGFFDYIGLKKSTRKANLLAVFACLLFAAPPLILTLVNNDFKEIMFDPNSITGKFRQMGLGVNSIVILLGIALFKTSLAEEIFFRGFVAKRLISVIGFVKGNVIQAIIFGIIHTLLFALTTQSSFFLFIIFLVPSIGAYVSVILNERKAYGSIIPGWIAHGLANVLSYGIVGFVI